GLSHSESTQPWGVDKKPLELSEQEKLLLKEPELKDSLKSIDERKLYDLNPEKLKQMWHAAMVRSLLKSKAKVLYTNLPAIERIVYQQCEADSKSLVQCLVRLLDERDRAEEQIEELQKTKCQSQGHSPSPSSYFASLVSPSSPFYQLTPLFEMFTPKPGPPQESDQKHRPPFSIKSFYSTNAIAEKPYEHLSEVHIRMPPKPITPPPLLTSPPSIPKESLHPATVEYAVFEDGKQNVYRKENFGKESQERLWMELYPYAKSQRNQEGLYNQLKTARKHYNPIRSQLRTLKRMRERRQRDKQWRVVESDHFRAKRANYLTIEEALEQFQRENRGTPKEEVSFLGTIPID
ncbi:hypothetical protein PFISCL1PPCAC_25139, partial [Pristionchus fissidentatus]